MILLLFLDPSFQLMSHWIQQIEQEEEKKSPDASSPSSAGHIPRRSYPKTTPDQHICPPWKVRKVELLPRSTFSNFLILRWFDFSPIGNFVSRSLRSIPKRIPNLLLCLRGFEPPKMCAATIEAKTQKSCSQFTNFFSDSFSQLRFFIFFSREIICDS